MEIRAGSFTGDGSSSRGITGIGFQPHLVIVKGGANNGVFLTAQMVTDGANANRFTTTALASITSLDADGFTVNADAAVNANGTVYHWIAVRDNGAGDFKQGAYTGNGAASRGITGVGFAPDLVLVKRSNTGNDGMFRTSAHTGNDCSFMGGTANAANSILSNDADGFTVGTGTISANVNAAVYYYFAFKTAAGQCAVGTYVGDGVTDRQVSGGFRVDALFIKSASTSAAELRTTSMGFNASAPVTAVAPRANVIKDFAKDGVVVGTSTVVNGSGTTYYWFAWHWRSFVPVAVTAYLRQRRSA